MEKKETQISQDQGNLIVPDTNVLINDPMAPRLLINGNNTVVITQTVIFELDKLKNRLDIGHDVRMAVHEIFNLRKEGKSIIIENRTNFSKLGLKRDVPDHQIIATFNYCLSSGEYRGYKKFKFITDDLIMQILAEDLFLNNKKVSVESYKHNRVIKSPVVNFNKSYKIKSSLLKNNNNKLCLSFNKRRFGQVKENSGILLECEKNPWTKEEIKTEILAYKKGAWLVLIPENISLYGLTPLKSLKGESNWPQFLSMAQLKDEAIKCVFLSGSAGSGKTILAIASALESDKYENIIITRPQVSFSNQEKNGFLPGDINEKFGPWLVPIEQNIRSLEKINKKKIKSSNYKKNNLAKKRQENKQENKTEVNIFSKYGIDIFSLEYIRGTTWVNTLFIVDESQNLTPQQIKTLITRIGEGSKIIFTGDLGQIDLPYLSAENSGLAYAIDKLTGYGKENNLVASVTFNYSVRSELAALADKFL